jgi:hypothetical protein
VDLSKILKPLRALAALLVWGALVWGTPIAGLMAAGQPVDAFLDFPTRTRAVVHAPFSWVAFALYALPVAAAIALYGYALATTRFIMGWPKRGWFPWWGWLGVLLAAVSWYFAWRGVAIAPEWRRHVFAPLWLGYILVMNGLAWRKLGRSLLTDRTGWFLTLFPVSAAFWWLFEHLNAFVDNWHYSGAAMNDDWQYFIQATLPFSTVLPAVASTWCWLRSFPRLETIGLPRLAGDRALAWTGLALGLLTLWALGIQPEPLFSALWLAPLALLAGLQRLIVGESFFAPLARGDWRPLLQPALAALICGLFWELWNWGSLAKWTYSVPYVQRFRIFEMPLLGYAGYLPFGLECALVIDLVARVLGRSNPLLGSDPCG